MHPLAKLDHRHVWHPFTQMRDWLRREPIVITRGRGAVLFDARGKSYLDANSSIWTNLHGHSHPKINAAIAGQLKRIAHSSALGLANEPASRLAEQLVRAAGVPPATRGSGRSRNPVLSKVFFSDDGSTAMEVALKLAYEFTRRTRRTRRGLKPKFLSLAGAYHGDTIGAVSLGHIDRFHKAYSGLLFKTDQHPGSYCYRCPYNRAQPERADARTYRKCDWECLGQLERKFAAQKRRGNPYAAFVFEPLMQGAAGMIPQPTGWLRRAAEIARGHGALLIADEVMTGFGRTGLGMEDGKRPTGTAPGGIPMGANLGGRSAPVHGRSNVEMQNLMGYSGDYPPTEVAAPEDGRTPLLLRTAKLAPAGGGPHLFACQHEGVTPDFLALAKGLTGGVLPMAATLTHQAVFDAFLGEYEEFKTFFHGHSFTGNQLGASAALASLELLHQPASIRSRRELDLGLRAEMQTLWSLPQVGDIRQVGLVAGVELVKNWRTREPFATVQRAGIRVCEAMARRGVLTRPVGDVVVLMPPYCTTPVQLRRMVASLREGVLEVLGGKNKK